jgi:hypothetical protein
MRCKILRALLCSKLVSTNSFARRLPMLLPGLKSRLTEASDMVNGCRVKYGITLDIRRHSRELVQSFLKTKAAVALMSDICSYIISPIVAVSCVQENAVHGLQFLLVVAQCMHHRSWYSMRAACAIISFSTKTC